MTDHENECGCNDGGNDKRSRFNFTVDQEPLAAYSGGRTAELTVREVLDMSGNQPPEHYYLVEYIGQGHKESVKHETLDERLHIKENARYAAVFSGCTPVSDKGVESLLGVSRLKAELEAVGVSPEGPIKSGGLEWLIVGDFTPPGGRFLGTKLRVAVPVPPDFPQTPPGGLYVGPKLIPDAEMSGLNIQHRPNETGELPGEWQYWSRPIPPGTWTPANSARRLVAHWNAVMMNV
jgi:hypothetical protein